MVHIPSGATNIDVRQGSENNKKKDDNYLGRFYTAFTKCVAIISLITIALNATRDGNQIEAS